MALLFVCVTHPSAFASSLNRLGLSCHISYAVALALRYLPEVTKNYLHPPRPDGAGVNLSADVPLKKRFSSLARVTPPRSLSLDRIDVIASTMVLRGFGRLKERTWYMDQRLTVAIFDHGKHILLLVAVSTAALSKCHVLVPFLRHYKFCT